MRGGAYDHFFDVMEEFGFFEHIYDVLPENFTAVFEIARILEDEDCALSQYLHPILSLTSRGSVTPPPESMQELEVIIQEQEEFEAGLIRNPQHLPRIYNSQWLLPEEVFYNRLAKKELWVPYPRQPSYYAVDPDADDFRPDHRKQKLYILLDTSSSMAMKNRINLAKAIVYYFLKRNMKELGFITLRTFDTTIGAMHEARDAAGFQALISHVMRLHALGNGTAMARAIQQAVEDINATDTLVGTELLIITDGACALDENHIRSLLGDHLVINTIKIGRSHIVASESYIRDSLSDGDNAQHAVIGRLRNREVELQRKRDRAQSPHLRRRYDELLTSARQELDRQINAMTEEIIVGYGHELERLSNLYLQVDDVDLPGLFDIREEQYEEICALFAQVSCEVDLHCSLDQLRKLALLIDHLDVLIQNTTDPALRRRFEELRDEITRRFTECIELQMEKGGGTLLRSMTAADRHDLDFLLSPVSAPQFNLWRTFIWKLLARLRMFLGKSR